MTPLETISHTYLGLKKKGSVLSAKEEAFFSGLLEQAPLFLLLEAMHQAHHKQGRRFSLNAVEKELQRLRAARGN